MSAPIVDLDRLVATAARLDLSLVPEGVRRHAGLVVADTVAVAAAGARTPEMAALVAADEAEGLVGATHPATVLTAPARRGPAAHAAFLNATAGTFLELDEGMRPTGHPAMHVVPAALAAAERAHATGADLLRAVLVGYEVAARLFRAVRLADGVHPHGHIGAIGAAVAVALLDGVDPAAAARIAATSPLLPVWQACYEGATARNTYTGHAASSGVRASVLARAGFTGAAGALDVAFGRVAGEVADPSALTAPLDHDALAVSRNYLKVHSACALSHTAIEAALQLGRVDPRQVREVRVETVAVNLKIARQARPNDLSARFSLPYAVAAALTSGAAGVEPLTYRPEVAELAERVHVSEDAALTARWPDAAPARVSVVSGDGTRTATVDNASGHVTNPVDEPGLRAKFDQLVDDPARADAWWPRLIALPRVSDCAVLFGGADGEGG
jgi:2-methylcitrate dehydratase PrpD